MTPVATPAAESEARTLRASLVSIATLGLALAGLLFGAGSALALDAIDLSAAPEATAEGECPRLIQIKYPFLACPTGQIGQSDADETWDDSRRIPIGSRFTEGNGFWGDDLNSN